MVANTISFGFAALVSFFLTPYITKHVGIEAYGLVGLANSFLAYVTLFTSALNSMASRFIIIEIHKDNFSKANEYFSSVLIANTIIALLLTIPAVWLICNLKIINISDSLMWDAQITFSLVILSFFFNLVGSFFGVVLYAKNILWKGSFRTVESGVLRLILILLLFSYLDTRIYYVALATFLAGLYPLFFNIRYTNKLLPKLKVAISSFSIKAIKVLISSGLWNSVTRLSHLLLDGLDLLLCNIFINGVMTGNVAIAKTLPSLFVSLIAVLSDSFYPKFLEFYSHKKKNELLTSVNNSINVLSAISGICLAFLIVYSRDLYRLWLPGQDEILLSTLTILALGTVLVSSCIYSLYSVFSLTNKIRANSIVMVISGIISIGITFLCLKITNWGVYAIVGVSSVIGILRNLFFTPFYAAHCLNISGFTFFIRICKNLGNVAILVAVFYGLKLIWGPSGWLQFVVSGLICVIIGGTVTVFFVFSTDQRHMLFNKVRILLHL